jgi:universal stress protein E
VLYEADTRPRLRRRAIRIDTDCGIPCDTLKILMDEASRDLSRRKTVMGSAHMQQREREGLPGHHVTEASGGQIERILVALDREGAGEVLKKAVTVARLFGARLELFLCDAEHAYVQQRQYDASRSASARESSLAEARQFLESLWRASPIEGVPVAVDVACESPLYMGIVAKVQRSAPDLVVRGWSGGDGRRLGASDWDLARSCPVPLLLTRGKPWKANPVIAAAVDLSAEESPALTLDILRAAKLFADATHGTLEVLHAGQFCRAPEVLAAHRSKLEQRASEADVAPSALHLVDGEPAVVLTEFATARHYDLMVLGALTHRRTLTALVGTLTGRLVETIESDFLLVKPAASEAT